MPRVHVTDHALVRFLERGAGLDIQGVRSALQHSLERAIALTGELGVTRYSVHADGLIYVVADGTLVTVLVDEGRERPVHVRERGAA